MAITKKRFWAGARRGLLMIYEQRPARPEQHLPTGAARGPVLGRQIQCIEGAALRGGEERRALCGRRRKRTEKISLGF